MQKNKSNRKKVLPSCSVVIAAAGSSQRMAGEDKLFSTVCGAPVLGHTLGAFVKCSLIGEIVVVARRDKLDRVSDLCMEYGGGKVSKVIAGGETRLESALNGVLAVSNKARLIAIHDGARPCVTEDVIVRAVTAAVQRQAVAPAIKVASTIKRAKFGCVLETLDRENLFEIQTPQVFVSEIIKAALTNAVNKGAVVTDDCMAAELLGVAVYLTEGSRSNIKLTTEEDLGIAEAILSGCYRSGNRPPLITDCAEG